MRSALVMAAAAALSMSGSAGPLRYDLPMKQRFGGKPKKRKYKGSKAARKAAKKR